MTANKVIGWLGFIAILGGVVRALMTPFSLTWGTDSVQELYVGVSGSILLTIGTFGIYLYQMEALGRLGFISFLFVTLGNLLTTCLVTVVFFIQTVGKLHQPDLYNLVINGEPIFPWNIVQIVNLICLFLGIVLFGFLTFRANILSRWAAIALFIFPFLNFVPIPFMGEFLALVWGISYIGLGYDVWIKSMRNKSLEGYMQS